MALSQDYIDNVIGGLLESISQNGEVFYQMIVSGDMKTQRQFDKLAYMTNIYRALFNYDYYSGSFTDDELRHLIEQANILVDDLPNNSNFGGFV